MKPNISYGFGALTPTTWREIYESVEATGRVPRGREGEHNVERTWILARITGAQTSGVNTRWSYAWEQVLRDTSSYTMYPQSVSSSTNGYARAFNLLEAGNLNGVVYGNIAVTAARELVDSPGFYFDPVPTGAVVLMRMSRSHQAELAFDFTAPNPITGTCPTNLLNYYDGGTY
jgi:hypothetical protein